MIIEAIERRDATQETKDEWMDRPFSWGDSDCGRMALEHLRRFGYRPKIAKLGKWQSALSAKAALKRVGCKTLVDMMDKQGLARINGAQAVVGDMAAIEADSPVGCLAVCVGPNLWIAPHEDSAGFTVIEISQFLAVWRVEWQRR